MGALFEDYMGIVLRSLQLSRSGIGVQGFSQKRAKAKQIRTLCFSHPSGAARTCIMPALLQMFCNIAWKKQEP